MSGSTTLLESAYHGFFVALLIVLALLFLTCLIRAVLGPRMADRIVAVNMMGTMVMVAIATLAVMLKEGYLVDICLIYAMISFLAVIILSKVYMGVYYEKKGGTKTPGSIPLYAESMGKRMTASDSVQPSSNSVGEDADPKKPGSHKETEMERK